MTLDIDNLGNKSEVMPMLVKLYDSQNLISLAKDTDPTARTELTSIVTSLLEMDLSPREASLIADVLISLMRQIERDLCIALSERLSTLDTVPLRLALHIANETIDIASPMLRNSQVFNDLDLIYIIKSKPADYWQAIAQREDLSDQVIEMLADCKDFQTALNLIENKNITLTDKSLNVLVDMAKNNDDLAGPLLRRDEVTTDIVKTLYQCVGMALKDYIRQEFEMADSDIMDVVDDVVLEFVESVDGGKKSLSPEDKASIKPDENHIKAAKQFKAKDILTLNLIMKTLKRGQYKSFTAQFAAYLELSSEIVTEVLLQKSGQGLAVLCKADSIQHGDFISIYMLISRMRNKGGMVAAEDISRATKYYQHIDIEVAQERLEQARKHDVSLITKH